MFRGWVVLSALLLCSCATFRGANQKIKVGSIPEGADVYFDGKKVGTTPAFVEIPRGRSARLEFRKERYRSKAVDLSSSYRWGDSFFANFIFLWAAPLGWTVDLLTSSSWTYNKQEAPRLVGNSRILQPEPQRSIAIAPPQGVNDLLSDEVAFKLSNYTSSRYRDYRLLPFEQTEKKFTLFSYTNNEKTSDEFIDDLYAELGTTHLLESNVEQKDPNIIVHAKLVDVYNEQPVDEFTLTIPSSKFETASSKSSAEELSALFSLVPNTISFDLISTSAVSIRQDDTGGPRYDASGEYQQNFFTLLTGFGFRNIKSPQLIKNVRLNFRFVPDVQLTYHRIHFNRDAFNPAYGVGYDWLTFLVGIGPELGLDSPLGFLYLQILPMYGINRVTWDKSDNQFNSTNVSLSWESEIGFSFFVSQAINLRIFERIVSVPSNQWSDVLTKTVGTPVTVGTASYSVGGLSLGYFFPTAKSDLKKLLIH